MGPTVAYFSMEIALDDRMPTYSGGLGVLAGDFLRTAADLEFPMVAVTLLPRRGYFHQGIDATGYQTEEPQTWPVEDLLEPVPAACEITVEGRTVVVQPWRYRIVGQTGAVTPVYFLDTDLEANDPYDRSLSGALYGGDERYRLCQEQVLGAGGVRMLHALGYTGIRVFHLNEGHAALALLELLEESRAQSPAYHAGVPWRQPRCVFTTHTPVAAGHDIFSRDLAVRVLGADRVRLLTDLGCCNDALNLTEVALHLSGYVNGVAKSHQAVSSAMFPGHAIDSITNGVHSVTWTSPPFQALYDRYIPRWRHDNATLRYALRIPLDDLWAAHQEAKRRLLDMVQARCGVTMTPDVLTLGLARRATAYKRLDLIFRDLPRLLQIAQQGGPLQIVCSGKAHPRDEPGKEQIRHILQAAASAGPQVRVAFLPDYDLQTARLAVAGADVWLNTPLPPLEASGTSGMKAAHNGVPSFSVLDGWWWEGHVEGVTGWAIDGHTANLPPDEREAADAESLYDKLQTIILPLFNRDRRGWSELMRNTIAHNAAFFNTQRMFREYLIRAYKEPEP